LLLALLIRKIKGRFCFPHPAPKIALFAIACSPFAASHRFAVALSRRLLNRALTRKSPRKATAAIAPPIPTKEQCTQQMVLIKNE
jgi:hypothetical protein